MPTDKRTGPWGERLAAEYLRKKHYKLLALNYHSRFGEVDIVAKNWRYIIFVEVKLRKSDRFGRAAEYVTTYKQERIKVTASCYLAENPTKLQPRFDVVEVYAPEGVDTRNPTIQHWEDAFE